MRKLSKIVTATPKMNLHIHGARGLFAFSVLLYHVATGDFFPHAELSKIVIDLLSPLRYGVELFFGISGYVIHQSLKKTLTPSQFLINRLSRLLPVLWAVVFVWSLLLADVMYTWPSDVVVRVVIVNLSGLVAFSAAPDFSRVAWTISYELVFYLLCFLWLAGRFIFRRDFTLPLILIGVVAIWHYPRAIYFLSGLLVAGGAVERIGLARLSAYPLIWLMAFLILWSSIDGPRFPYFQALHFWSLGDVLVGILAFLAATFALDGIARGRGFALVLKSRTMLWLGTVSYSMYLWHYMVLVLVATIFVQYEVDIALGDWTYPVFLAVSLLHVLLVSVLSQRLLEQWATMRIRTALFKAKIQARA